MWPFGSLESVSCSGLFRRKRLVKHFGFCSYLYCEYPCLFVSIKCKQSFTLVCGLLADADKSVPMPVGRTLYILLFRKLCRAGLLSRVRFMRGCFFIFTHLLERLSEGFQMRFLNPKAMADGKMGWFLSFGLVARPFACGPPGPSGCLCDHSHLHSLRT